LIRPEAGKAASWRASTKGGLMYRWIAVALLALMLGVGLAACGEDDENGDTTTTETTTETTTDETDETTTAAGRVVFIDRCGACHTLSEAGTTGTVGPGLDDTTLSEDEIADQVREGGGGMPAFEGDLSDEEIESVAAYVAAEG
jgi:mono/diheme cytochrome c family protein